MENRLDLTEVIQMRTDDVIPYDKNPRHNDDAVDAVAASISEFGFQQPIVVDRNNVVIVGHTRLKAAKLLGRETVPVVVADLPEEKANAYRLADNKTGELATWDLDLLAGELEKITMDMEQFGFELDTDDIVENFDDEKYTAVNNIPQYEPTGAVVFLEELCDDAKARELIAEINSSGLSDAEKGFLLLAATRHYRFNYKKIAEYYVDASEEMQRLMEKSALVIIDIDDAIRNGYAKLSSYIDKVEEANNA